MAEENEKDLVMTAGVEEEIWITGDIGNGTEGTTATAWSRDLDTPVHQVRDVILLHGEWVG